MPNVETIIQIIFGGDITVQGVATIVVAIWGVIMGILGNRAKLKLIKADRQITNTEKQVEQLRKDNETLRQGFKYLGDIICTAYLSNPNVDEKVKKQIAVYTTKLEETTHIDLESLTTQLVETVTNYVPQTNIVEKQETITAEVKKSEEELDAATASASDVINQLEV